MRLITIVMSLGLVYGCGSDPLHPRGPDGNGDEGGSTILPSIRAISPTFVTAGSSDVTLTVIGTNFVGGFPVNTFVMWSANGVKTPLATRFVSTTELSAVIPTKQLNQ